MFRRLFSTKGGIPKIYVGNLNYNATEDGLRSTFTKYGEVLDAYIIRDKSTGRSKGFGFIEFTEESSAESAVKEMDQTPLDGRTLRVDFATPRLDRQ